VEVSRALISGWAAPQPTLLPSNLAAATRRTDLLERLLVALRQAGAQRQPKAARRSYSKTVRAWVGGRAGGRAVDWVGRQAGGGDLALMQDAV